MWRQLSVAVVLFLLVSAPLQAAPIIFLDRDTFLQAVQPNRAISFEARPFPCDTFSVESDFCQRTSDDGLLSVTYDLHDVGFGGDTIFINRGPAGLGASHQFLTPVTAIGFDLGGILLGSPPPTTFNFTFAGTTFALPGTLTEPQFFGAILEGPVNGIPADAGHPGARFFISNLVVQTVPEPGTLLLFGTAAAGILGSRRRFGSKA
jgi:hypothetical protein